MVNSFLIVPDKSWPENEIVAYDNLLFEKEDFKSIVADFIFHIGTTSKEK